MCTRCFFPLGVSSTSNQKVCSFTLYAVFIFIYSFTHFYFCIHRLTEVMNAKAAIRSEYARLEAPSYALGKRARRGTLQKAASIVTAGSTQAQSRVLQKSVPKKAAKMRMKAPPRTVAATAVALKPSAKATPNHDATKAVTSKAGAQNAAKSTARSRDVASMPVTNPYEESESDCKPAAIPSKKVSKPDSKPAAINRKKVSKPDSKSAATSSKLVSKPESQQVAVPIIKKRSKATWPPSSSISKKSRISSKDNDVISLTDDDSSESKATASKNDLLHCVNPERPSVVNFDKSNQNVIKLELILSHHGIRSKQFDLAGILASRRAITTQRLSSQGSFKGVTNTANISSLLYQADAAYHQFRQECLQYAERVLSPSSNEDLTKNNSKSPLTGNKGVKESAKWMHSFQDPTFGVSNRFDSKRIVDVQVLPSPPLTNINNEGRKNIEQETLISSKEKNIVKAKEAVVPTPPALLNNISSPVKNPVHLRFDRSTKNYDSNTNDSVLESAAQSEKNARKENSGNTTVDFVHRPAPPVLDPALKPVALTKHTTKANRQGKDEEDISIASEDASDAGPSLEFLKSVEKSNMKLLGINCKDHKQVEKGPHLTLQRDRNTDETLGETWSIIKLPHSISLQQDHVQPGLKPVPPTKHITRVIQHTTRVIPQGKDDEDSSILSEDVPSLEFLKSVQKSSVKEVPAVDKKDDEVTKGRLRLILQKKDHVKPVPKPVPPTKHTSKLNSQSQDEDSSNVSEDGPSLEFLKSVEKSVKKIQPTVPPFFAKNEVNVARKKKGNTMPKKGLQKYSILSENVSIPGKVLIHVPADGENLLRSPSTTPSSSETSSSAVSSTSCETSTGGEKSDSKLDEEDKSKVIDSDYESAL